MKNILSHLSNNKEISIVVLVVLVIMMMIIPLSTVIMDSIIAFNLGITVLVLMVIVYMESPLELTSFPGILLVLALLRIGITVSTSRLILLDGDAGAIVQTFGEFVVSGNLVVGIIIFTIITLINFIVITKGSERVAEVAARFSLDAMPGKQMSIDSDLRAGNITMEEAQLKRSNLALESKLFGAMDGAMKFVKGDAIASIVDVLINIIAGLIIGVAQKNMTLADAAVHYTILTVGDGLVQQIPSLIISLTAGLMITRVSADGEDKNMGERIIIQLFSNHKSLFAAASLLCLLSLIPGMPYVVLLSMAGILISVGFRLVKINAKNLLNTGDKNNIVKEEVDINGCGDGNGSNDENHVLGGDLVPLMLHLPSNLKSDTNKMAIIKDILIKVRQGVLSEFGVRIPQIVVRFNKQSASNEFQFLISEIPAITGVMYWDMILLIETKPTNVAVLSMDGSIVNNLDFGYKSYGVWIDALQNQKLCDEYNIPYVSQSDFVLGVYKRVIMANISDFLGIQETKLMLDGLVDYQDLIKELLRMLPLNKITEIFQRLIAENISIRNFKLILDTLLDWAQREKETVLLVEYVRIALGKYIAYKFSDGKYLFAAIVVDDEMEDLIRDSVRFSDNGTYLSIDPEYTHNIINNLRSLIESNHDVVNLCIITSMDIRKYVRSIIEKHFTTLNVLSTQELANYAELNTIGILDHHNQSEF